MYYKICLKNATNWIITNFSKSLLLIISMLLFLITTFFEDMVNKKSGKTFPDFLLVVDQYSVLDSQPLVQRSSLGLEAFLAEQGEHVLLVSLYAGLVEGVHLKHVAAEGAGHLEEVD